MSDDKLFTDFNCDTVVPYFCAMDHSESPRCTLCEDASASCAPNNAAAIAADAVTDITTFLLAKIKSSLRCSTRISAIL